MINNVDITLISRRRINCLLRIAEGAVRRWRSWSTGRDGQSKDVKRFDRKSQAQMAESVQKPEDQLAHHATAVRQVSHLFPPNYRPFSRACRENAGELSDATEMIFCRATSGNDARFALCHSCYSNASLSRSRSKRRRKDHLVGRAIDCLISVLVSCRRRTDDGATCINSRDSQTAASGIASMGSSAM